MTLAVKVALNPNTTNQLSGVKRLWERRCITRQVQIRILKLNYSKTTNIYTMGLCVLYYVEYSLFNVKKVGFFFYLGWNYTLNCKHLQRGKKIKIGIYGLKVSSQRENDDYECHLSQGYKDKGLFGQVLDIALSQTNPGC